MSPEVPHQPTEASDTDNHNDILTECEPDDPLTQTTPPTPRKKSSLLRLQPQPPLHLVTRQTHTQPTALPVSFPQW